MSNETGDVWAVMRPYEIDIYCDREDGVWVASCSDSWESDKLLATAGTPLDALRSLYEKVTTREETTIQWTNESVERVPMPKGDG